MEPTSALQRENADLGSICMVSKTADLELLLDSRVEVAANDPNFTVEELLSKSMGCVPYAKPWVMQGDAFKLVVSLDTEDIDLDSHGLMQAFAQKLYDSKVYGKRSLDYCNLLTPQRCGKNSAWSPPL